jgi:hypothetical protein
MPWRAAAFGMMMAVGLGMAHAASVSREHADSMARKIELIEARGADERRPGPAQRTSLSESELNSWFTYHAPALLPEGVTQPRLTIVDSRRVTGTVTVNLDAIAKRRQSGRTLDVWNLIGGRMPVTVSGVVVARSGRGRFDLQSADISGVPVPRWVVQELVDYYSRTPERPSGVRIDEEFALPSGIQGIELRPGMAVVVQ